MNTTQIPIAADDARYLIEIVGQELRAAYDADETGDIVRCEGILRTLTSATKRAA